MKTLVMHGPSGPADIIPCGFLLDQIVSCGPTGVKFHSFKDGDSVRRTIEFVLFMDANDNHRTERLYISTNAHDRLMQEAAMLEPRVNWP